MTDRDKEAIPDTGEPAAEQDDTREERYPELAELQREVDRRIRDNQRFLEKFLDDDFDDDEPEEEDEIFEEL